jgi:hypothetical protein
MITRENRELTAWFHGTIGRTANSLSRKGENEMKAVKRGYAVEA